MRGRRVGLARGVGARRLGTRRGGEGVRLAPLREEAGDGPRVELAVKHAGSSRRKRRCSVSIGGWRTCCFGVGSRTSVEEISDSGRSRRAGKEEFVVELDEDGAVI